MLTRKIVTAAGLSLFAMSLAACVHDHRPHERYRYDHRHDWNHSDRDWRFDHGPRHRDYYEHNHWYY